MDIEGGLISSVVLTGQLSKALERRVTAEFFDDPMHRRVWEYVVKHYGTYGSPPGKDVVLQAYPSYDIDVPAQPVQFYIEQLAKRRRLTILMNGINEAVSASQARDDPDRDLSVRQLLQAALVQTDIETAPAVDVDYGDYVPDRVSDWRNNPGVIGTSYGFPTLDRVSGGLKPEQFVIFTGLPKTRKSWSLLYVATTMHVLGESVLYVSFEMSKDEQAERLATLWAKIPYSIMRDKTLLTDAHVKAVQKAVRMRRALRPFLGVEDILGHSTTSALLARMKDKDCKVLFIDGIYLMTDEHSQELGYESTQALTNISRGLKRLAMSAGISVVVTTQILPSKVRKNQTNLYAMGYTSAFSQDADLVVGVEGYENEQERTTMRVLGNRSGPQGVTFDVRWDLDNAVVEEYAVGDGMNEEGFTYEHVS